MDYSVKELLNMKEVKSIPESAWQSALDSQSACNLSGLAHALVRALDDIRESGVTATDDLNRHSIVKLYVAQMAWLSYSSFDCNSNRGWNRAYDLAQLETGIHPLHDRALQPGERESIEAKWGEETRRELAAV